MTTSGQCGSAGVTCVASRGLAFGGKLAGSVTRVVDRLPSATGTPAGAANASTAMIFNQRNCNYPQPLYGQWWLTQLQRWGFTKGVPDYVGIPKKVLRPDIYMEAMKEMSVRVTPPADTKITLFDSVFDSKEPEKYARSFAIHSLNG